VTSPDGDGGELRPIFSRPVERAGGPRDRLADEEMLPATAYQIVHDETMLDGNPSFHH
jgi:glutamate decarboxylase